MKNVISLKVRILGSNLGIFDRIINVTNTNAKDKIREFEQLKYLEIISFFDKICYLNGMTILSNFSAFLKPSEYLFFS
jgi:hypothetical protein